MDNELFLRSIAVSLEKIAAKGQESSDLSPIVSKLGTIATTLDAIEKRLAKMENSAS